MGASKFEDDAKPTRTVAVYSSVSPPRIFKAVLPTPPPTRHDLAKNRFAPLSLYIFFSLLLRLDLARADALKALARAHFGGGRLVRLLPSLLCEKLLVRREDRVDRRTNQRVD